LVNNNWWSRYAGFSNYKIREQSKSDYVCNSPNSVYKDRWWWNWLIQFSCNNPSGNRQTNYGMDIAHDNVYAGMHLTNPSNWLMTIWIR